MKRVILGVLGVLVVLLLVGYAMRTTITLRMMERAIAANMQTTLVA